MSRKKKFNEPIIIKLASHEGPQAKAVEGKDWLYWGKKNDYFQFLLDTFYNASKHNAIVNGKTKYVAGGGWGDEGKTIINSDKETLDTLTWKTTLDMEIYGGFAMEVLWTKGGKAEYRHVDFSKVRTNKDLTKFYYTKDWLTKGGYPVFDPTLNEDWTVYEPFDPTVKGEPQLLYYKCYSPGLDVYPYPEYQAALRYIELEYQIANYWYNRVKNGFMPSAILNFYTQPTDDEMRKLEERIKAKFTSTDNAGQFILNFATNKEFAADIQQLTPPELGTEYEALNKTLQTEIFTGHGITSGMLFGIKESGQLSGRTELIEANELFQNRYVNPKQDKLNDFYAEYVFPYVGIKEAELKKIEPIGFMFSETVIVKHLPSRSITDMIAAKMGVDLKEYPEHESEQEEKKEAEMESKNNFASNSDKGSKRSKQIDSKKEAALLSKLKAKGRKRNIKEVIYSRPVTIEMAKNLKASEMELQMNFKKTKTPILIGDIRPIKDIVKETPTEVISVVYSYEWIEGFDDTNIGTSRDFCVEMRADSKAGVTWTREDIDTLDNGTEGENALTVWEARGGWYNDNGIAVPACRHQWYQQVIREVI